MQISAIGAIKYNKMNVLKELTKINLKKLGILDGKWKDEKNIYIYFL